MESRLGNLSFFRNNAIGYKMQQMLRKGSQKEKRKEKKRLLMKLIWSTNLVLRVCGILSYSM